MSGDDEEQQGLLPTYQETSVELKDLRPTSELTNVGEGSSQSYQKLVVKYRWIPEDCPKEFKKLTTEFYLDPKTPLEDAVEFALSNPPLPLSGADWSHKIILTKKGTPISVSRVPIDAVFPERNDESNDPTVRTERAVYSSERALYIVSDPEFYDKEGTANCTNCITVLLIVGGIVIFLILFIVWLTHSTKPRD